VDPGLLAFAFAAGAVAAFAPCCIGLLPAYVAYAVRPGSDPAPARRLGAGPAIVTIAGAVVFVAGALPLVAAGLALFVPALAAIPSPHPAASAGLVALGAGLASAGFAAAGRGRVAARGAAFGALACLGFLAVFLVLGLPVALLAHRAGAVVVAGAAAVVGVALVVFGVLSLAGRSPGFAVPGLPVDVRGPRGFLLFGAAYGVASLSCTFPVFLSVVAAGLVAGGFLAALGTFAAFGLGQGAVLVAITAMVVAGGDAAGARVRRLAPAMHRASSVVLVVAGAYVAWYFGRALFG